MLVRRYPGLNRGSVFLAVTLALGVLVTRAQAQRQRLDSIVATLVESTLRAGGVVKYSVDSQSVAPLPLSGIVAPGAAQYRLASVEGLVHDLTSAPRLELHVSAIATADSAHSERREWTVLQPIALTTEDRSLLETNSYPFVHLVGSQEPSSFWSSTVEPALVILGAGAIIALFFLIRS